MAFTSDTPCHGEARPTRSGLALLSTRRLLAALTLAAGHSAVAHAQDTHADSSAAWAAATVGYAAPGTALGLEAWLRVERPVIFGAEIANADRGGYDSHVSTNVYSAMAGLRVPVGPFHCSATAGLGLADGAARNGQNGAKAVWNLAVDLPMTRHVALHTSRFAIIGGDHPFVLTSVGLSIGGVR